MPHASSEAPKHSTLDLVDHAFECALRGDQEALAALVTLLKTKYGSLILSRLRHHRGRSQTATLEDIFQESIVDFMEEIQSGALSDLESSGRRKVLGYFQRLCDRKLENLRKARVDPLYSRKKTVLPEHIRENKRIGGEVPIPGEERQTEQIQRHEALLRAAMRSLGSSERSILERYLAGVPYAQISAETGIKVSTLESLVTRTKQKLSQRILGESRTARIHQGLPEDVLNTSGLGPIAAEIRQAIDDLPLHIQEAIAFVHLEGRPLERLARKLGADGLDKAQARLHRGYESLSVKLDLPFPDSFSLLKHE